MAKEEEGTEEKAEGGEAKGGKKKTMLFIIIAVVVLLIGAGGAFFALSGSKNPDGEEGEDAELEEEESEVAEEDLPGAIFPLEVFIVNLTMKGSFLKTSIQLEFGTPEVPHHMETSIPKVRDAIIRVLSSKAAMDILTVEGKEKLREEIKKSVNDAMGGEEVTQIYFTEFIVQ